jgi:hypothetical protein
MYKVIFKIEKVGDKELDRELTIMSVEMDLEFTSKSEVKIPPTNSLFMLNNEEFVIKRKIDSLEKYEDDVRYITIVFLESVKYKNKFTDKVNLNKRKYIKTHSKVVLSEDFFDDFN